MKQNCWERKPRPVKIRSETIKRSEKEPEAITETLSSGRKKVALDSWQTSCLNVYSLDDISAGNC